MKKKTSIGLLLLLYVLILSACAPNVQKAAKLDQSVSIKPSKETMAVPLHEAAPSYETVLVNSGQTVEAPDKSIAVSSNITAIEVLGNKLVPLKDIEDVVFSRAGEKLLEEKINNDLKAIYSMGFFSDTSVSFESQRNGTKVVINVVENPVINAISLEGSTVFPAAAILGSMETKSGQILNYNTLRDDIEKITALYKSNGYILARVADVQTDEKTSVLSIKIIEGVIEAITLSGNEQTQDYVVMRELNTKTGKPLNENTLKKDLRRVFNLGFFSEVNPVFEPGTTADKMILQLNIKESRTSTVNFGGGYGEREGWFGFADLSVNNLLGTAQGLLLRGQVGQELSTYQFRYTNPWFLPDRLGDRSFFTARRWLTVGRDIYLTEQDAVYNGFDLSLGKTISDYVSLTWSLGSELVSPYSTSTFEAYQSDTIGLTLAWDTRDFWLNPKKGQYYTFQIKQGWKYTTSCADFFKIGGDVNHYFLLRENQVFAFHVGAGMGFGAIPIGEEYYAGGANSVRGHNPAEDKRGPRKLITNFEYRMDFSDMFQGVVFYDWGDAWDSGAPDPANFIAGYGPGVRVNTPLGPIRLDYGLPAAGGAGVLHFSIGQAF
ncbi:MAG: BamA/TamA family outer membrane protein [Candidatus Margulisbacteria bacterium]|nr:BamA/TamA family outer membrane protein [Candidatus Margulisiibacteriota bacterium]